MAQGSAVRCAPAQPRPARRTALPGRLALALALLTGLVALLDRGMLLGVGLGHDEALAVLRYVRPGPHAVFGDYTPNDHLLFNLLAWATTRVLPATEAAYRLWSVLPALAAIALAAGWLWRRVGPVAGLVAAVALTSSPLVTDRTSQARGYGLVLLGLTVALAAGVAWQRGEQRYAPLLFAGAAVVSVLTFPLAAVPLAGQVVLLATAPALRRRLLQVVPATALLTVAVLAPVLAGLLRSTGQLLGTTSYSYAKYRLTEPYGPHPGPRRTAVSLLREGTLAAPAQLPAALAVLVLAAAAVLVVVALAAHWPRNRMLLLHGLVPGALLVAVVAVGTPYAPRFVLPGVVYLVVPLALAAEQVRVWLPDDGRRWLLAGPAVALAVASLLTASVAVAQRVSRPPDDYRAVGRLLAAVPAGDVYTTAVQDLPGLLYYVGPDRLVAISNGGRAGLPTEPGRALTPRVVTPQEFQRRVCRRQGPVAVVETAPPGRLVRPACADLRAVTALTLAGKGADIVHVLLFAPPG